MTFSTADIDRCVGVARAFEGDDLDSTAAPRLLALQDALVQVRRMSDVALGEVAGALARRSDPADGVNGVARQRGFASAGQMLADALGASEGEAHRILAVAGATQPIVPDGMESAVGADGGVGDGKERSAPAPRFPTLAQAVMAGRLSMEAAAAITRVLDRIEKVAPDGLRAAEKRIVAKACVLPLRAIRKMLVHEEARHRPEDVVERDRAAFENRYLQIKDEADGSVGIHARLDASTAAPIVTVLRAEVRRVMQVRRDNAKRKGLLTLDMSEDDRTPGQIQADALSAFAAHTLGCKEIPTGTTTRIVLHADIEDLKAGIGCATIEGIESEISIETMRRMAVDCEFLPVVMGTRSLPLDVGEKQRLFTEAQKIALAERDGGCAWCHAPLSFCQAHHIEWWMHGGPTDLANGVMLCVGCHHRVHAHGWGIEIRDDQVWFIPPASVDGTRTPRVGGKRHYELTG